MDLAASSQVPTAFPDCPPGASADRMNWSYLGSAARTTTAVDQLPNSSPSMQSGGRPDHPERYGWRAILELWLEQISRQAAKGQPQVQDRGGLLGREAVAGGGQAGQRPLPAEHLDRLEQRQPDGPAGHRHPHRGLCLAE